MTKFSRFEEIFDDIKRQIIDADSGILETSPTMRRLFELKLDNYSDPKFNEELDYFSLKYEISGRLLHSYKETGQEPHRKELSNTELQLFAALTFYRLQLRNWDCATDAEILKNVNVSLKIFSNIELHNSLEQARQHFKKTVCQILERVGSSSKRDMLEQELTFNHDEKISNCHAVKTLPIDILFYEGPIARAYLETLLSIGCKPRTIVKLISEVDVQSKKRVGKFLPRNMREIYAASVQKQKMHHWPKYFMRSHKELCNDAMMEIQNSLQISKDNIRSAMDLRPLEEYADVIEDCPVESLSDPRLYSFLNNRKPSTYLYTGGGIIPKNIFHSDKCKFVHIHPGYLPGIGGADCLLWSILLKGVPSASCFYMEKGIDTGEIIRSSYLPRLFFPKLLKRLDIKDQYRFLYSFYDPWVRSFLLRSVCLYSNYFENINSYKQDDRLMCNFHFMHNYLVQHVISKQCLK